MQKINIEIAIGISFLLGLILPLIGLGGVFSLFVMGFVATFLTKEEITSAKVGAIATGIFCIIFFFYGFLTPPTLPYILPNPLTLGILVALSGVFNLVLSLIASLIIYCGFGLLGGYIAMKFFIQEKEKKKKSKIPSRPQRRTLKRA
jgi:hypothetical protein